MLGKAAEDTKLEGITTLIDENEEYYILARKLIED